MIWTCYINEQKYVTEITFRYEKLHAKRPNTDGIQCTGTAERT
jgi:hypothetical protein